MITQVNEQKQQNQSIHICFFFIHTKAITQIITERREPPTVANPIGKRLENTLAVIYTPGILTRRIAIMLWIKESSECPQAQK